MERLTTYESIGGHAHAIPTGNIDTALMRLADYEDTGLTPEEIHKMRSWWEATKFILDSPDTVSARLKELYEADKDGRVMVLPCKVGDTVWAVNSIGISSHVIRRIERNKCGDFACSLLIFPLDDFGKTVFLTREEAEKALEEEKWDG